MEPFHWNVRVRTTGAGLATAYVRKHSFEIGVPLQFDLEYNRITALEYILGAIAADVVNGMQASANRRRVEIDDMEAVITGRLNNPLTHLGVVGEKGHPGLEHVAIRVYISSLAGKDDVRAAWEETLAKSPLVQTFDRCVTLELHHRVVL